MNPQDLADLQARRQTLLPKRLGAPGPDAEQLRLLLQSCAHAPDHGQLLPWRWVIIGNEARAALAEAFVQALHERGGDNPTPEQCQMAREKAHRGPLLMVLVVDGGGPTGDGKIPWDERVLSAGCAAQNLLLMATALGLGAALTSGKSLQSQALRDLLGLQPSQQALCFVSVGSIAAPKAPRSRPDASAYVRQLQPGQGMQPWE